MTDFSKFRSAFNGFQRSDVVTYIEELSIAHKKELHQLQEQIKSLQEQNEALDKALLEAKEQAATMQEKTKAQEKQLEELNELLSEVSAPDAEPEKAEPAAEAELPEKELAAYRRAEAAERNAANRANKIYTQLSDLCETARSRCLDSSEEIEALTSDLSAGLARLQDAFAEAQTIFDNAQNAFEEIELPECGSEIFEEA